ncbi:unnamed protein product [Hymenolepis diminuta]|uniref:Rap-GAP domain-containing protein n=1 Tax=Hymenolepis diminuta TaxID=6216 RepID=A0A0R3SIX4_HYMDI|nr:unnamed protein product [Hymenolepis diminuta]
MLSHPHNSSLSPSHQTTGVRGLNGRASIQRTSSVSSLLFTRRPSTSSLAGVSNQLSPLHQRLYQRPEPTYSSASITDLDHCFGGSGGGCNRNIRRSRDDQRDGGQDLYDFLKGADLEEYYTVFSKYLKDWRVREGDLAYHYVFVVGRVYYGNALYVTSVFQSSPPPPPPSIPWPTSFLG